MARTAKITRKFRDTRDALGVTRDRAASRALSRTINTLCAARVLPGRYDTKETINPETFGIQRQAYVRRVQQRNLWLWYQFDALHVVLAMLTNWAPPVVWGEPDEPDGGESA
jgi:hypothetical protein